MSGGKSRVCKSGGAEKTASIFTFRAKEAVTVKPTTASPRRADSGIASMVLVSTSISKNEM